MRTSFFSLYICLLVNFINVSAQIESYDILVTEIMADPTPNLGFLPNEEYFELYNNSDNPINLRLLQIQVGTRTYTPPDTTLNSGQYIALFDTPTLKNSGDSIVVLNNDNLIHRVDYRPSWITDGFKRDGGWSLEMIDLAKPCLGSGNWDASANSNGGSPNVSNSLISEFNSELLTVENWFTIGDSVVHLNFNLPIESIQMNYNYDVNYNQVTLYTPINETTQNIAINSATTCFEATFNDTTLIVQQPELPTKGDIVINEILFNPTEQGYDYIEVHNISDKAIDLNKVLFSEYDVNGDLKPGNQLCTEPYIILPQGFTVLCSNKEWLLQQYGFMLNVTETKLPNMNNDEDEILLITPSGTVIDSLAYSSSWHHHTINDEKGKSLEKIIASNANNASNWATASFTQNYGTPGTVNSQSPNDLISAVNEIFTITNDVITPNGDGYNDYLLISAHLKTTNQQVSITVFDAKGVEVQKFINQKTVGTNELITWNCTLNDGRTLSAGAYLLFCNTFDLDTGTSTTEKITFYINQPW